MIMEAVHEDIGDDGNIHCTNHPFQNNSSPGGICAFCLQEKLGKLVSSSFPSSIFPSSTPSSSASPSFRSDFLLADTSSSCFNNKNLSNSKPPLVLTHMIPFNRCKSTATSSRGVMHLLDENYAEDCNTPHRGKFWYLFYKKNENKKYNDLHFPSATPSLKREEEENIISPSEACFDGKVSRSRSVGCGSRSFSFGDCNTLRRVESQREGNTSTKMIMNDHMDCTSIKERVKCGGIFSGFMFTSSSNWESNVNGRRMSAVHSSFGGHVSSSHGRSKSWGWALASPMRVFSKPSSAKRGDSRKNNGTTPDLNAIPSLLSV